MSSVSRSAADPLARIALGTRLTVGAALPLLGGLALWALKPLDTSVVEPAPQGEEGPAVDVLAEGIDPAVFDARLWNPAAGAAVASAEVAPTLAAAPLRLQLVGVIEENGQLVAALYDPDKDELRLVRDGMSIGQERVTGITLAGVTLTDALGTRELKLRKEKE